MKSKRLESITEIAIRNELSLVKVMQIYTKFNAKIYIRSIKKGETSTLYDPVLEEKTFKLTERYFDMFRLKELKNGE